MSLEHKERRLNSIQILRALAALLVLFLHSGLAVKYFDNYRETSTASSILGRSGVDLFFLISGYIFCRMSQATTFNLQAFVRNRFRRIYPNYWVFTMLVIVAHLIHPVWNLGDNPYTFETISKSLLIFPQRILPILAVGWTLEHEMIFYTIFATLNYLGKSRYIVRALLFLGLIGITINIIVPIFYPRFHLWDAKLLSLFQFEFAAGALVFKMKDKFVKLGYRIPFLLSLIVGAASLSTLSQLANYDLQSIVRVVGFSIMYALLMIAALNCEAYIPPKSLLIRLLVLIGEASYSLYLSHWLVLSILGKVAFSLGLIHQTYIQEIYRLVAIASAILFAIIYYKYIETRLIRSKTKATKKQSIR